MRVKASLALEAIVKAENLAATEEEVEAEIKTAADAQKKEIDEFKTGLQERDLRAIRSELGNRKAADFVLDNAKLIAPKPAKKTAAKSKDKMAEGEKDKLTSPKTSKASAGKASSEKVSVKKASAEGKAAAKTSAKPKNATKSAEVSSNPKAGTVAKTPEEDD